MPRQVVPSVQYAFRRPNQPSPWGATATGGSRVPSSAFASPRSSISSGRVAASTSVRSGMPRIVIARPGPCERPVTSQTK